MKKREKWLCRLVCMAVLATFPLSVSAAESTDENTAPNHKKVQAPITVDSRDLDYNNQTGDIIAAGDVTVMQGSTVILADEIYGNSKTHMLASDGQMRILDPEQKMDIIGTNVRYNYQDKTGSMERAEGKVQGDFVEGEAIEMLPDKTVFQNAKTTECPAKSPCWHVMAKDVEMHANGATIAHDATFYLKNKPLYHTKRHEREPDGDHSFIPHPGYNSSDGFYIKQDLEFPIFTDGLSVFLDWGYYSHHGFRSTEGLQYRWSGQAFRIVTGDFEDSDDEWIEKKIEYQWEMFNRRIGKSKFSYRMDASHGLWEGAGKKSWHDEYNFYLTHDP
ncbi:MAG: LPS-assembly protein LptD, partial [Selenomonadales bacterium]|nr:LPS-assembly protein LptD [Selenomonadales bacterium]